LGNGSALLSDQNHVSGGTSSGRAEDSGQRAMERIFAVRLLQIVLDRAQEGC
jgi:hypothetical protein